MSERSLKQTYNIPALPPDYNFDTLPILKALNAATRALAESQRAGSCHTQSTHSNRYSLIARSKRELGN